MSVRGNVRYRGAADFMPTIEQFQSLRPDWTASRAERNAAYGLAHRLLTEYRGVEGADLSELTLNAARQYITVRKDMTGQTLVEQGTMSPTEAGRQLVFAALLPPEGVGQTEIDEVEQGIKLGGFAMQVAQQRTR